MFGHRHDSISLASEIGVALAICSLCRATLINGCLVLSGSPTGRPAESPDPFGTETIIADNCPPTFRTVQ